MSGFGLRTCLCPGDSCSIACGALVSSVPTTPMAARATGWSSRLPGAYVCTRDSVGPQPPCARLRAKLIRRSIMVESGTSPIVALRRFESNRCPTISDAAVLLKIIEHNDDTHRYRVNRMRTLGQGQLSTRNWKCCNYDCRHAPLARPHAPYRTPTSAEDPRLARVDSSE